MKTWFKIGLPLAVLAATCAAGHLKPVGPCMPYAEKCLHCRDCSQCGHCAGKGGKCSVCWRR